MSQTGQEPHSCNPVNNQCTTTGRDLVRYVNRAIAINRSMPKLKATISIHMFQRNQITLITVSGVYISTKVYFFSLDQNQAFNSVITSYALFYITQLSNQNIGMTVIFIYVHLMALMYVFIRLARIDIMQFSYLHTCLQQNLS